MPKIFDKKNDNVDKLIYMAQNKCMIAHQINKYDKCELCDDIPEDKIYKCIKCLHVLCEYCTIQHLIKTNDLYECEKCDDIYDRINELEWFDYPKPGSLFHLCKKCIKNLQC